MIGITRAQLRRIVTTYQVAMYVITISLIVAVGAFLDKTAVAIMSVGAFVVSRKMVDDVYHCSSMVRCLLVSCAAFLVVLRVAPTPTVSLASGPILSVLIAYASGYIPKYAKYAEFYSSQTAFDINNPTEPELRARCAARKFTAAEADICVKLFCKQGTRKLSAKEYMHIVGASDEWTARNIKSAYKKRLM